MTTFRSIGFGMLFALWSVALAAEPPSRYVDPFIGTDDMGHTYPGRDRSRSASCSSAPQTDLVPYSFGEGYNPEAYRYCSGYQYGDRTIVGFAHTHFNGTGHSDLGDLLVMPTVGELQLEPGTAEEPESGYRSRFSHERETAEPGAYRVTLDDYGIEAELTATERVGVHRYTFPESEQAHLILDLTANIYDYPGKTVWSSVRMESDTLLTGYAADHGLGALAGAPLRHGVQQAGALLRPAQRGGAGLPRTSGAASTRTTTSPSAPAAGSSATSTGQTTAGEQIVVKVALSQRQHGRRPGQPARPRPRAGISTPCGPRRGHAGPEELARVQVDADPAVLANFYTALYHCRAWAPVVHSDVDGRYRGLDGNIHRPTASPTTRSSLSGTPTGPSIRC